MGLSWGDLSEVTAGYLLRNKLPASAVNAETLCEPYDRLVKAMKGKKQPDEAGLIDLLGLQPYSAAMMATEDEKIKPGQAVVLLEKAFARASAAQQMEKELRKLRLGEDADLGPITAILDQMKKSETRLIRMSDIEPDETPLIQCGYEPIDKYVGGVPEIGVTVIAGPPGSGKTSLAAKLLTKWVKLHKEPAAYFSLELTSQQLTSRALQIEKLTAADKKLIWLCDKVDGVDDLCSVISKVEGASLIIIDFAELAIDGEAGESVISSAYRKLLWEAKNLGIPIIVLSQMNRKYDGSVPSMVMVKWAGEQLARLVLLIYNPESVLVSQADAEVLPPFPGEAYLVVGKSTFGTIAKGLGAVRVHFRSETGWGDKAIKWHPIGSPPKKETNNGRKA